MSFSVSFLWVTKAYVKISETVSKYEFCIYDNFAIVVYTPLHPFFFFSPFFLIIAAKREGSSISKALLKVEHFSWKCVTPGELVLKMHTYATKATVLNLPVGYVWGFAPEGSFLPRDSGDPLPCTLSKILFSKTEVFV